MGGLLDLRQQLLRRLADARARTDALFALLEPDALYDRPVDERHRLAFYLGHLEAFDWNLLGRDVFARDSAMPSLDKLFAFGIDPVGGGFPMDRASDWPARGEIEGYGRRVRRAIDECVAAESLERGRTLLPPEFAIELAIEHRLMHAETLAYLFHRLPFAKKVAPIAPSRDPSFPAPIHRKIEIPAGGATLGRSRDDGGFGWDNEYSEHAVAVPAFAIDAYPVTNRRYLAFVEAGGYEDERLWSAADWAWKEARALMHPVFWTRARDHFLYRGMFAETPLPLDAPVYVSHAEASAYARWAGDRLPSEAEWHRAAFGARRGSERPYPWGSEAPDARRGAFDFVRWDPAHVSAHPAGDSAFGVADLFGNGWEWTASVFSPFPGFEPFDCYPGYSANFFDGNHYVLKGASVRTAACMVRRSFRNWFQPHYPYVYATFRCVSR